jgi:hypothetical protein
MTTRRIRRTVRRSGNGLNVVADLNAVISTGGAASSSTTTTVTQTAGQPARQESVRRAGRSADEPTRGEQ